MTVDVPEDQLASQYSTGQPVGKRGRRVWLIVIVLLLIAATAATLRWVLTPTEPALWRVLPPGADLYIYANLADLRRNPIVAWYLKDGPGMPKPGESSEAPENETRRFIEATGFRYEESLHQLAAARRGDEWVGAASVTIDRGRFEDYLKQRATQVSRMGITPVYVFGSQHPLRVAIVSDRELVFSVGASDDALAQALLLLAQRADTVAASGNIAQAMSVPTAEKWRAILPRPFWVVGKGEKIFGSGENRPTWGGFLLGEETLAGVESLLVSIESGSVNFGIEGELLCKPGVAPKPLADNLTLLATLMRPRAPEANGRDLRPVWEAVTISTQDSSVYVNWRPTPQMLSLLSGGGK